jgi:hypothetical protein
LIISCLIVVKWQVQYTNNISPLSSPTIIQTCKFLLYFIHIECIACYYILAIFGISNHPFGEQYEFEKTRHERQMLKTVFADLTDNHTRSITDEKKLIQRVFNLLSDNTM